MHFHGRYRLPLGLALSLHELQVCQSISDRLAVFLDAESSAGCVNTSRLFHSAGPCNHSAGEYFKREKPLNNIIESGSYEASYFGAVIYGQVVRGAIVNYVLLSHVISPISQAPISLVPRIRVEIVHLVVDPRRHRIVERLVVDVILIIAARIVVILTARYRPMILVLVLVRALINTNYGRVIRFSRPFRRLENGHVKSKSSSQSRLCFHILSRFTRKRNFWLD